jgi:molybdopterin-guanine dinucleotide biosynthesis protein A
MNEQPMSITGVIMAGGKSSRMGTDKGLVVFNRKPFVQYAIDLLKPLFPELIISTQNPEYGQFGLPLLKDEIPDCGPLGGIYSALKASKTKYIFVLACDMPFVTTENIEKLLVCKDDFECVIPKVGEKLEPLCAIYSKSLIKTIEESLKSGNLAMHHLVSVSNCRLVDFDAQVPDFQNINSPDELNTGTFKMSY